VARAVYTRTGKERFRSCPLENALDLANAAVDHVPAQTLLDHFMLDQFQVFGTEFSGRVSSKQLVQWAEGVADVVELARGLSVSLVIGFGMDPEAGDQIVDG
jgi:hypothetical protein